MSCERTSVVDWAAFLVERDGAQWADLRDHYPRCSDCSREVARWSRLTAALEAEEEMSSSGHPSEQRLLAFQQEPPGLAPDERSGIEAHLASCGACRSELAVLRSFDFAQLAPLAAPETGRAPALSRTHWERLVEALEGVANALFPSAPRPALALGLVVALLVPAGLVWWRLAGPSYTASDPPIAHELPPAPTPLLPELEPSERVPLEIAEEPPAPEAPSGPIEIAERPSAEPELAPGPTPPIPRDTQRERLAERSPAPPVPDTPEVVPDSAREPIQIAALVPSSAPRYLPDAGLGATDLSGLRDGVLVRAGSDALPGIRAVAPAHIAATAAASPTLYWFLSDTSQVPVEITLSDEEGIDPLLELRLEPPLRAGLHAVVLGERGVRLDPGTRYRWYVSLVPSDANRDRDATSGAELRRVPANAALEASLAAQGPAGRAHILAEAGYWVDAFETLTHWIEAEPDAAVLRSHRAALLEQVGLAEVAAELALKR